MGLFSNWRRKKQISRVELVTENTAGYYNWGGTAYDNDIVRACVNARAKRFCKLTLQHIRETSTNNSKSLVVNPEPYIRLMLQEPNPYMSIVDFLAKICRTVDLSGNAFVLILRDSNGLARELYPIPAQTADAEYSNTGELFYKLRLSNGQTWRFSSGDIIHLRDDYNSHEIFGESKFKALAPLQEVVNTTDKGIINAIKNSNVIRWLLKYTASLRPEMLKQNAQEFADNYLNISNKAVGVAAVDAKADATQVSPQDYVPNATQMNITRDRIYGVFNINEKIVKSLANENEENAYYESCIEPLSLALQAELTRKLFSARERGHGNYIAVGTFNLRSASINTKLNLWAMVDRGALLPNEWRETLGLPPVPGGDKPLRRLDTQPVTESLNPVEGGEE